MGGGYKHNSMNKLKFFIGTIASLFLFSSCFIREEIDISNTNGYYSVNVDMSQAFEMMKGMGGKEMLPDSLTKINIDTVVSLGRQIDSLDENFSDIEKNFFRAGTVHMNMNMKENLVTMEMKYPVSGASQLNQLFQALHYVDSLGKLKKKDNPASLGGITDPKEMGGFSPEMFSSMTSQGFPYIVTDTSIERKAMSTEEIKQRLGDQLNSAAMFMSQMSYVTTFKLPRPVKKYEGKNIRVLDDKKTVVFSANLSELMDDPAANHFYIVF